MARYHAAAEMEAICTREGKRGATTANVAKRRHASSATFLRTPRRLMCDQLSSRVHSNNRIVAPLAHFPLCTYMSLTPHLFSPFTKVALAIPTSTKEADVKYWQLIDAGQDIAQLCRGISCSNNASRVPS